ncbi:hypothetical protein [Lysobacter brunescens]|uniref:Uncharacterized protein n=1 Tax=Lysobacter brunescens TaxID=262323 RepID=A0ABW2YGK9_9GAMM
MATPLHVVRPDILPAASSRLADPDRAIRIGASGLALSSLILTTISSTAPYCHVGLTHGPHIRHEHIQDNAFHMNEKLRHDSAPVHDGQES